MEVMLTGHKIAEVFAALSEIAKPAIYGGWDYMRNTGLTFEEALASGKFPHVMPRIERCANACAETAMRNPTLYGTELEELTAEAVYISEPITPILSFGTPLTWTEIKRERPDSYERRLIIAVNGLTAILSSEPYSEYRRGLNQPKE